MKTINRKSVKLLMGFLDKLANGSITVRWRTVATTRRQADSYAELVTLGLAECRLQQDGTWWVTPTHAGIAYAMKRATIEWMRVPRFKIVEG